MFVFFALGHALNLEGWLLILILKQMEKNKIIHFKIIDFYGGSHYVPNKSFDAENIISSHKHRPRYV